MLTFDMLKLDDMQTFIKIRERRIPNDIYNC